MLNSSLKNPNDEEFQKNCIKDFLHNSFGYSCNTRGKVDLAIYSDEIPKVLFEVKATGNKAEFVKTPDSSLRGQSQNRSTSSLQGSGDSHNEAIHKIDTHPLAPSAREGESLDCHESANADSRNDDKSPLLCGGDLGVGKSTQRADSNNDSTKEILAKYNKIFLSIRICDPAVGSGHFLVSALNELIAIKSELGLLLDCEGVRLSDIDLVLENDELLIKDSLGNALDYRIPAHEDIESHKI